MRLNFLQEEAQMAVSIETHGHVEILRMNRAEKKNALTGEMYNIMTAQLKSAASRGVRAIVFAGVEGAFTAGNDLKDFLNYAGEGATPAFHFIRQLAVNEVPLVAAVNGLAVGVGTTMLFHCDLVYASEKAMFKMPFVDLGLVPEAASSLIAPRAMGLQKASEYVMLGESFDATDAYHIGLVNRVVASQDVENKALEMAQKIASKPQNALSNARKLLRGEPNEILNRMNLESEMFGKALASPEAKAAFTAFLGKSK
jgi:enoyl-CoA hydratase/carnithine racemase